jgi:sulfur carrier protein ThiS
VAKIFDLAQHAGVTPRVVLDVVNGRPINEDAQRRVAAAIEALGQPDRPVGAFRHVDVVAAESEHVIEGNGDIVRREEAAERTPALAHDDLMTAALEALRAEVRPVGAQLERMDAALEEVVRQLRAERRARIDDLELLSELVIEGWRGIDRRLGRLEKTIARIDDAQSAAPATRSVKRLEDWIRDPSED